MTQMVLAKGPAQKTQTAGASPIAVKSPRAVRVVQAVACGVGLLVGLNFWLTTTGPGLIVLSLLTVASLAHAWFQARRRASAAVTPGTPAAAASANQANLEGLT